MAADDLGLPDDPYTLVFREAVAILQDDEHLRKLEADWKVGKPRDPRQKVPVGRSRVGIRLRPVPGPSPWYSPDSLLCPLLIVVTLEVAGTDPCGPLRLWHAMARAFYPGGPDAAAAGARRLAIQQRLRAKGADTGEVLFEVPPFDALKDADDDQHFVANGAMKIGVRNLLNP